jgi:hypothetical protein
MARFAILVDGERAAGVESEDDVRTWLATYRKEHVEDDPAAAHVQILERGRFAWLSGGKLLDRELFL